MVVGKWVVVVVVGVVVGTDTLVVVVFVVVGKLALLLISLPITSLLRPHGWLAQGGHKNAH